MEYKNKAVVLGTNYYIGIAVVRTLGKKGIHVVSVNHNGVNHYGKSRYVKEALIAPHYKEHGDACLEFLINYAKQQEYKPVLLATADPYVEFMDKYFHQLKEYYLFPMDRKGLLTDLMDKYKLTEIAKKYDVLIPEIINIDDDNIYERVAKELKYPCIVKPKDSPTFVNKYREKAIFIRNERELKRVVEMCRNDKMDVFIQRIIPGPEQNNYNFDAYMTQDGKVAYYTTEYKIRQWPINFGASTVAAQKWIPEAAELSIPFLEAIGFKGFVEVEMKRDENNGKIYMVEVNVRYVNFTEMHIRVGMDTPYLTYMEMIGEDIGKKAIDYDTGAVWRYLFEDIPAMRAYVAVEQYTREEIREQNNQKFIPSTWSLDDPWPGIKFASSMIIRKIGRTFGLKMK